MPYAVRVQEVAQLRVDSELMQRVLVYCGRAEYVVWAWRGPVLVGLARLCAVPETVVSGDPLFLFERLCVEDGWQHRGVTRALLNAVADSGLRVAVSLSSAFLPQETTTNQESC